jgi:EAL domain-containing protein (putative c-di-GMP-specific phosphodiesterase class I)/GAF domain-containing protein
MEWVIGASALLLAIALILIENLRRRQAREHRAVQARTARYRQAFIDVLRADFTEIDDVLQRLLRCLLETISVERVSFWLFESDRTAIVRRALVQRHSGQPAGPPRLERQTHPRYFDAVGSEFVVAASDAHVDLRTAEFERDYLKPLSIGAMLDVPVRMFGKHVGLVCVEHVGGPRTWTREDQTFAAAVATQLAFALERDEHNATREALVRRTLSDIDTGLPNLVMLRDRLRALLGDAGGTALLIATSPQARLIEATRGHGLSERLMQALAKRIALLSGEERVLARIAKYEFALLLPGESQLRAVEGWALRLRNAAAEPIEIDGEKFRLTLNVGYSVAHAGERIEADRLINEASSALRDAEHGGHHAFDPAERSRAQQRFDVEQSLRQALDEGGFESWLQPLIDLQSRRVVAFESLLRWRFGGEVLSPARFLSEAIDSGLIVPIGRFALSTAIANFQSLCERLPQLNAKLAINLSAPELMNADLERHFIGLLDRSGIAPERITLEVTETALVSDLDRAQRTLDHLRASGISICLDDFGTGFSSLTWLKRFPITEIKIESSFVRGMGYDPRDEAIVQAVVTLAQRLGQHVVAEGVENREQLDRLSDMGVRYVQGYYFSPPASAQSFDEATIAAMLAKIGPERHRPAPA